MNNPLSKYFRTPGIHITLPSKGKYTPNKDKDFTITNELPVLPMTASDEIIIRNPDGLLNGFSIEKIIESCVPGLKNIRNLPTQDIDMILLAIKLSSYGDSLALKAKCPECESENEYEVSIKNLIDTARSMTEDFSVRLNDELIVYLRPYDFECSTKLNLAAFEETKMYQNLVNNGLSPEDKTKYFTESFEKIASLNLDLMSRCIEKIVVPGEEVTNQDFIKDFIKNSPGEYIKKIKEGLDQFKNTGIDRDINLVCHNQECLHTWDTEVVFDPSHFFG